MFSEQMRSLETMLEFGVSSAYANKGIKGIYDVLGSKDVAKKKSKERHKKEFNETSFEIAHICSKIMLTKTALALKDVTSNKKERDYLADKLIEFSKEIKSLK